ncbi:MAG: mycofactocin biosynthesis chaperone MftB, partial [Actinomycetota bacterium]
MSLTLDSSCELDPRVSIRPEPFGALAYHYGNRRLVFLRNPDIVSVVSGLAGHGSVRD